MDAKEYLGRVRKIDDEVCRLRKNIQMMKDAQSGATDPVSGDKLEKYQSDLNEQINALMDQRIDVEKTINLVVKEPYRDILTRRYLHYQRWSAIAAETLYDQRYLFKIHNKALELIEKMKEGNI